MRQPNKEYQISQVESASAGELVVMLYDGCLRALERASAAMQHDNPTLRVGGIIRNTAIAQEILTELQQACWRKLRWKLPPIFIRRF